MRRIIMHANIWPVSGDEDRVSGDPIALDRPTILTWGLIGPGKGIEWGIEALALLGDLVPSPATSSSARPTPRSSTPTGRTTGPA